MPSIEQLRSRLLKKLSELFQLDQPDLDFGFYRIMHAKAQEVQDFIDTDLLKIVADAFGDVDETERLKLQAAYEKAIQTAKDFGAPNPEETEPVKNAKAALDALKDTASAEADVYDHLYRFFERYYDDGDFISRRYYTRETPGRAAPFAVPYNGEEVKLVWANMDQYYVKSAEYFSNYTFDLTQSAEIRKMSREERGLNQIPDLPLKVHFRVVEVTEGEHDNVKASEANKRFFMIHKEKPVTLNEAGELVCNFEYRPDPEKTGQEGSWRDKRNAEAVETILERLQAMAAAGGECEKQITEYLRLFKVPSPTESDRQRPLLTKYINQYTARNTMDYFIHKDLGGFLRRELDFYIKNEVMRLDDIENADAPAVESYLAKIKVLRRIAGKLIDFLAQLEDFQKKLWLKKKFVVETNYCITLDRVPEELYSEIAVNETQCKEWIELFAIDEIQADLHSPGFSRPLTVEFLKANNKLVLDTRFFDERFKARLVASIENFDEQCDGLLIHSENFQALNLLQDRYYEQVKLGYADPPYNTELDRETGAFIYKDSYESSTWATLAYNRFEKSSKLISSKGSLFVSIDDNEVARLRHILDELYGRKNFISVIAVKSRDSVSSDHKVSLNHNYLVVYAKEMKSSDFGGFLLDESDYSNPDNDLRGPWKPVPLDANKPGGDTQYGITNPKTGEVYYPPNGRSWAINRESYQALFDDNRISFGVRGDSAPKRKLFYRERIAKGDRNTPISIWKDCETTQKGTQQVMDLFGGKKFSYPKPVGLMHDAITISNLNKNILVLDFFAGSGTTGHAVIDLNRADDGMRKYILVEMGDYFDTVLKPRIAKVVYSKDWKDGKPTARHTGVSHCFKYIRLESYEDTLNNLRFDDVPAQSRLLQIPSLKEDYMLRYLLDVETRGSQSLLNIDAFADPSGYTLDVKKPGTDEYATRAVDLIETFNYLIGLRVLHTSAPQTFQATFKRITDPDLPEDQHTKLVVDGRIRQEEGGPWWFRKVEGWVPKDPANPNNGQREKVLVVWRKLTDDIERDNLMLDEWFDKNRISTRDFEFDTIYVNGSNNLPNLKLDNENWKVCLIEEAFMKRMWNGENA